jgi:hypothetical protein
MKPVLHPDEFVYCTLPEDKVQTLEVDAVCRFIEAEGVTLILPKPEALRLELNYIYECRMITLDVHSSLDAVGFIAIITSKLAQARISVNPVSGYYHDHLFVPSDRIEEVISLLNDLNSPDSY